MDTRDLLQRAVALHREGRLADAEPLYRQVLDVDPEQPDALHLLGLVELQKGDVDAAIRLIREASALNPSAGFYRFNLAKALAAAGQLSEAEASYQASIELTPEHFESRFELGSLLFRPVGMTRLSTPIGPR